jgi:rubredoxin
LVLTERVEVCGKNCERKFDIECGKGDGKVGIEREGRGKEQGFRPNMRDLDAEWMCPFCGIEGEKGRRCVYVLAVGC